MKRKYRSQGLVLGGMLAACALSVLLGASLLTHAPSGDVGDRVLGALFLALGCVAGAAYGSSVVVLTQDGIVYRSSFRRQFIAWDAVKSLRTVRASGRGPWFSLGVELRSAGTVRIAAVRGNRRHIEQVIAGLEEFRTQAGTGRP